MNDFSITQHYRKLDIDMVMDDDRFMKAMDDIAEAIAISERQRPLWPDCPLDQMYLSLNEWKDAMIAARDYKQGELSANSYRQRLAILSAQVVLAMINLEDDK